MSRVATLQCRCGEVRGKVTNASPRAVTRAICYCDDCQAYLHHLGRADLLDSHGGTDIVQVAPSSLSFDRGGDRVVGLRLSPKGLYRWYASCCKTPMGNTVGPALPFIGLTAQAFESADEMFGQPLGGILGKHAVGTAPEGSTSLNFGLILHALRLMLGWKLSGKTWPHPYFDRATKSPSRPITVLTRSERDSLRPMCGPHPTAQRA
ncbi:MAG: DUF6151 family protein [Polyangiaceae bacterium]